ncbi:hypothetical protein LP420_37875 [Massilia sp. B-10]|nr:hypothetical protein LP420_37875 [Massilia sp. B-10]
MLAFIQMMLFALVSGLVAPLLFDSALKLALGVLAGLAGSFACWRLSLRMARGHRRRLSSALGVMRWGSGPTFGHELNRIAVELVSECRT